MTVKLRFPFSLGRSPERPDLAAGQQALDDGDYPKAAEMFLEIAQHGNAVAQFNLGMMYHNGRGVPQDDKEAVRWFHLAAAQGQVDAQFNLGVMYDRGFGVGRDYEEAARWYRIAADQGAAEAQLNLGVMYHDGSGVPPDDKEALSLYHLAANQGYALAQLNLGARYQDGDGVSCDLAAAERWYRLAADQGNEDAQLRLGRMHDNIDERLPDVWEAVRWYRLAAGQGNATAQLYLGRIYVARAAVVPDPIKAHFWYSLAAASGSEAAVKFRDFVASSMTPDQIAEAQRLARKWAPKTGPDNELDCYKERVSECARWIIHGLGSASMTDVFSVLKYIDDLIDTGSALGVQATDTVRLVAPDGREAASAQILQTLQNMRENVAEVIMRDSDPKTRETLYKYIEALALSRTIRSALGHDQRE